MRRPTLALAVLLLLPGCSARFDRPAGSAGGVEQAGGGYVDPNTGLPVDPTAVPQPGTSGAPGATTGPGGMPLGPGTGSRAPGASGPAAAPTGPGATRGPGGTPGVAAGSRDGVTDNSIKLCYLIPQTGAAPVPPQVGQGIQAYWEYLNRRGGIHGRRVTVQVFDTTSDESQARIRAQEAIDSKCFAVAALDRLGVQKSIGEYLDRREIPNIAVQTPVNLAQDQEWTFGITIDHGVQGRMIANYFAKQLKAKKVAVILERDATLRPGVAQFEDEARRLGLEVAYKAEIDGQGNDFSAQAGGLRGSQATAVWLYMAPIPMRKFVRQAEIGYHPTWFGNSISWNFDIALTGHNGDLNGAKAFSPWPALNDPRTRSYQAAYRQIYSDPPLDLGIPGWGIGQIIGTALTNAGRDLGRNSFRHAMQHLRLSGTSPLDGTPLLWSPLGFAPGVRQSGSQVVTFRQQGDGWVVEADYRTAY